MSDPLADLLVAVAAAVARNRDRSGPCPTAAPEREIRRRVGALADLTEPVPAADLIEGAAELLTEWGPQVTHPRYLGLFNPDVLPVAVAGDALGAALNPQLALWAHAPAAQEMERQALAFVAERIGHPAGAEAHFTSGGQEANLTAVLAALGAACPEYGTAGARALPGEPKVYLSAEGHDSFDKVVRIAGLGAGALRRVAVRDDFSMDPDALAAAIAGDRAAGCLPVLAVATAGTTTAGAIDPIREVVAVARDAGIRVHVDAAWGGMAVLSDRHRPLLDGIADADSVTIDAHKGFHVPLGAGMYLARRKGELAPLLSGSKSTKDPYGKTVLWSRRALGLPLWLVLAERGAAGMAALIDGKFEAGARLRESLTASGCRIVNRTPLPLVCFTTRRIEKGATTARAEARRIRKSGAAWLSEATLSHTPVLRACITNSDISAPFLLWPDISDISDTSDR